jgi:NADH dehydrogenase
LGDCALFTNPGEDKPVPALAQTATIQARYVARNIVHALKNKPLEPCRVRLSGLLVSVGQRYAVAELLGVRLSGFLAWWIWRTIYLFKLVGRVNKIRVAIDWTMNLFSKRDTSQL